MIIRLKRDFNGIKKGTKGEKCQDDPVMYRFEAESDRFDYAQFSWQFIKDNKDIFETRRSTD